MKKNLLTLPLLLGVLLFSGSLPTAAQRHGSVPRSGAGPIGNGRAGSGPISQNWKVSGDLAVHLAKYRPLPIAFHANRLTPRERRMVYKLVEASQYLDDIFWRQNDPPALTFYQELDGSRYQQDRQLRKLLLYNASRFDALDGDKAFLGAGPMPPGRGFYPAGLTPQDIETYLAANPQKKSEIYSPYTVVRRADGELQGIPYHVVYRAFLEPAAQALRDAAALSDDKDFAGFLRLRAQALLDDDYYPSDLAWLELKDPRFDVIFGPYETYMDGVLGVKTTFGAAVLIRDEAESKKLAIFQRYVSDIQEALPLASQDKPSKKGLQTPMEVMDSPFRAGDLGHGYQAVADSLPNDPRMTAEKGNKKIFFKNFMDARVNDIILPLVKRTMRPDQAAAVSTDGYLAGTLLHEISHGLGPAFAQVEGHQVDIREAIGPVYAGLEEAKADAVGMFGLIWLMDHDYLPKTGRDEYLASYVADIFRSVRFGIVEAHAQAEMMEFNYFLERGAIVRDPATQKYAIDYGKMTFAINDLAKELLEQEATGDRARAEAWFVRYDVVNPELKALLDQQSYIPVDIAPVFAFPAKVQ